MNAPGSEKPGNEPGRTEPDNKPDKITRQVAVQIANEFVGYAGFHMMQIGS